MMKKKKILPIILLNITALCLALILAEVFMHLFSPVKYRRPPKQLANDIWRELLHKPSPVSGLAYELAPNREKYSHGAMMKTNSFGMRDDEPHPKNDNSLNRIAVLGDSFTFGFGVRGENTYPNVLERLLNKEIDDRRFEVLNFGVGGYSTRDEALVFKHKAIKWNLDLVIFGYVFNDPEIDPIQPLHSYYDKVSWWQYSNLLRLFAKAKRRWDIKKYGAGDYLRYLHATNGQKWQSVVGALEEIKNAAAERKITVLLVIFPPISNGSWAEYKYLDLHQQIADTANEKGIFVVDLYGDLSQYPSKVLRISPHDWHPSKIGHEVAAHTIFKWIVMNKEKIF
jgi:lysophospholipase L1-like esterase